MSILKPQLSPYEKSILKVLLEHNYDLNTTQVAKLSKMSWNTADKHLKDFHKHGWIEKRQRGNRDYWRAYR
jgi:predicted transcriptional regulator